MMTVAPENYSVITRPSRPKTRVLIADDSPTVRERLVSLLGDLGDVDVVGQARDEAETVRLVRSLRPDVVILDIRMPEGSGIGVLRSLRNEAERPKFIMLTNYPYLAYRRTCLEAGASYFFDKSSEFDQIPQALEQLTRKVS
jgi:DNA-binding NarL/FixJ family response regulator